MNSTRFKILFILIIICFGGIVSAQNFMVDAVITEEENAVIIFPNAYLYSAADSVRVYEMMGDETGKIKFEEVEAGDYYLEVDVLGYYLYKTEKFTINSDKDLGHITLKKDETITLSEALIKSDKAGIQYKVDRQIINADSFPNADVAMDLLENVPSVSVDVEGNLKYRGDGTFKVFINGHPVANGTDKLKEIPTAQIERIEIITNPPAQYASAGTAGIIQVILKKSRLQGYAINANLNTHSLGAITGYFSVDHKSEKSGWYVNANGGHSIWNDHSSNQLQTTQSGGLNYVTQTDTEFKNGNNKMFLEAGLNHDITSKDYIDVSFYIEPIKTKNFNDDKGNVFASVYDESGNLISEESYQLHSDRYEKYNYLGGTLNYEHYFKDDKSHKISAYADVTYFISDYEGKKIDSKIYENSVERIGNYGYEKNELEINGKINYAVPFSEKSSLEAGLEADLYQIPEISNQNGTFDENGQIEPYSGQRSNQLIDIKQNIYSAYATFKSSFGKLEYQLGLRAENTDTKTDYRYTDESGNEFYEPYNDNFIKLFPSAHVLYSFSEKTQLVANYTRRIDRPGYWQFVPFQSYSSITSYFRGNAAIKPAYTNAYELGFKQNWTNKNYLSVQLFHRMTEDVWNNINTAAEEGMTVAIPVNVGNSFSNGVEIMGNYKINNWWESNLSISLFDYKLKVDYDEEKYDRKQFNYQFKWNNSFKLPADFAVKFNMLYNSPEKTAQGQKEYYFSSSASIQKSFYDEKWTITLGGNNIFDTGKYKFKSKGDGFTNEITNDYKPYAFLKIAFKFDNQN